jgi:hypothetical protein
VSNPQYDYDGHIMRTPDEWCRIKGIQILDADGWRGHDAKDWSEPLTELDFEERALVCTQRNIAPQPAQLVESRATGPHHPIQAATGNALLIDGKVLSQIPAQPAGERHTDRLPNDIDPQAIEAATKAHIEHAGWDWNDLGSDMLDHEAAKAVLLADMRVALRAAYPAIRQQVAEQIAARADQIAEGFQDTAVAHRDLSDRETEKGKRHQRTAHAFRNKADGAWAVAHDARDFGSTSAECPSCHTHAGHPHTDYCKREEVQP